jgi:hypothetical protein
MSSDLLTPSTPATGTKTGFSGRLVLRGVIGVGLTAALAVGLAGTAFAQPGIDTPPGSTEGNVEVTSSITLSALTPSFLLTGIPGATQTGNGAVTYNVQTNNTAGYAVTVQGMSATMAGTGANTDTIPIGAVSVKESSGAVNTTNAAYKAVTVGSQQIHTQATRSIAGVGGVGDALSNDYQVVIPFVNSDTYTATLDYVATTL